MKLITTKSHFIEGTLVQKGTPIQVVSKPRKKEKLTECIIATSKCKNDHIFLVKARDRAYHPKGIILHDFKEGVERVMFLDTITGYNEGMYYNHNTDCVGACLNTALSVTEDEKMGKMVSKSKVKSPDGVAIDNLMLMGDFEKISESITSEENAITGHTFLLELDKKNNLKARKFEIINTKKPEADGEEEEVNWIIETGDLNLDDLAIRTNHSYLLPQNLVGDEDQNIQVGYTVADSYVSSLMRKTGAEEQLKDDELRKKMTVPEVMETLKKKKYEFDDPNNTNRDCYEADEDGINIGLRTTAILGVDLTDKTFYYDNVYNKSTILMILNKVPEGTKTKLKIKLLNSEAEEVIDY